MHWRKLAGILLVAGIGIAFAWLFRRDVAAPANSHQPAEFVANSGASDTGPRGQIVPLVVGEGFTGTAFVPSQPGAANEPKTPTANRVVGQPTIRRKPILAEEAVPELASEFPQPLRLLGLEDRVGTLGVPIFDSEIEEKSQPDVEGDNAVASAASISEDETPVPQPATHVIVDGDTLPAVALHYLGDESRADEIFRMNRATLPSFDLLPIGVEIELPDRQREPF